MEMFSLLSSARQKLWRRQINSWLSVVPILISPSHDIYLNMLWNLYYRLSIYCMMGYNIVAYLERTSFLVRNTVARTPSIRTPSKTWNQFYNYITTCQILEHPINVDFLCEKKKVLYFSQWWYLSTVLLCGITEGYPKWRGYMFLIKDERLRIVAPYVSASQN